MLDVLYNFLEITDTLLNTQENTEIFVSILLISFVVIFVLAGFSSFAKFEKSGDGMYEVLRRVEVTFVVLEWNKACDGLPDSQINRVQEVETLRLVCEEGGGQTL